MSEPKADARFRRTLAREAERLAVARARQRVVDARTRKKTARARARELCQEARDALKHWRTSQAASMRARIQELRAELKAGTAARRLKVKACCSRDERVRVRAASDASIAAARAELAQIPQDRARAPGRDTARPAHPARRAHHERWNARARVRPWARGRAHVRVAGRPRAPTR